MHQDGRVFYIDHSEYTDDSTVSNNSNDNNVCRIISSRPGEEVTEAPISARRLLLAFAKQRGNR